MNEQAGRNVRDILAQMDKGKAERVRTEAKAGKLSEDAVKAVCFYLYDVEKNRYMDLEQCHDGEEKALYDVIFRDCRAFLDEEREAMKQAGKGIIESWHREEEMKPVPARRMNTVSAAELMQMEIPPKKWIVKDLIAEDQVAILAAPRKLGKSWFCLQMCLAVCEGKPFLTHTTNRAGVLYCDLESTYTRPRDRLKKLLDGRPAPEQMAIAAFTREGCVLRIGEGFEDQIREKVKETPGLKLVVVDVYQNILPPAPKAMDKYELAYTMIRDRLKVLAAEIHVAFLLVMHTRKGTPFSSGDPFDEIMGSAGNASAADTVIVILKDRKSNDIWMHTTGKDIEEGSCAVEFDHSSCRWNMIGDRETVELNRQRAEYAGSQIPVVIRKLISQNGGEWSGTVTEIIEASKYLAKTITDTPQKVGEWIRLHEGFFWSEDQINVETGRDNKKRVIIFRKQ